MKRKFAVRDRYEG